MNAEDVEWMRYALTLAGRGRGHVEPNPMVGAVVVRGGELVGEGWHEKYGSDHAEINAINRAGTNAQGATLYVTLEPCCHFGKTPPCVNAVIHSGINRVVIAMSDPFPQVSGGGMAKLVEAGLAVEVGCCEQDARELNRPYLTLWEKGRPYVHLKWAMSLDGKIATYTGDSQWISNEASRAIVHELRGRMDAIIVGANTLRIDDPRLTARPPGPRTATRIVMMTKPELPANCQLMKTLAQAPVVASAKMPGTIDGVEVVVAPTVTELVSELARRRCTNILVEGGSQVFGSFMDARLVDEIHTFISPVLFGGNDAISPTGGVGAKRIQESLRLARIEVRNVDGDIYIRGII